MAVVGSVAAVAAVVGATMSVVGAYEAHEAEKDAYNRAVAYAESDAESQTIQDKFNLADLKDSVQTNKDIIDNNVNTAKSLLQDSYDVGEKQINALISSEQLRNTSNMLLELGNNTKTFANEVAHLKANAELESEYLIGAASIANNSDLTNTAIASNEYYNLTSTVLAEIDSDVNTIMENVNRVREMAEISKDEEIGKVIAKSASTVAAGGSNARRAAASIIKTDMMKQEQLSQQTSALDKAVVSKHRAVTDLDTKTSSLISSATNSIVSRSRDTALQVNKILKDTNLTTEAKRNALEIANNSVEESTSITNKYIREQADITLEKSREDMRLYADKIDADSARDKINLDIQYETEFMKANRDIENTLTNQAMTGGGSAKAGGFFDYVDWATSPDGKKYLSTKPTDFKTGTELSKAQYIEHYVYALNNPSEDGDRNIKKMEETGFASMNDVVMNNRGKYEYKGNS